MINYCNQKFEFNDCPVCAYAKHEFSSPCGMAYEDSNYTLSQDWKLPIPGFHILSPKRNIEKFIELLDNERILDFLTQVKNPYVFKANVKLVRFNFSENVSTADACLTRLLENLYR